EPWLPVNPDYPARNASVQATDPLSMLSWYKRLIALRRSRTALREGRIAFLDLGRDLLAYERAAEGDEVLVLLNFASAARRVSLGSRAAVLAGSERAAGTVLPAEGFSLAPLEAVVAEPQREA
ncbi:MAG: DUF3459 domain-containing protein, partial [Spirochaetaceae bacterium]|nr:DUF3459 domain-containing protein [Spirochaetaceae bacterium]